MTRSAQERSLEAWFIYFLSFSFDICDAVGAEEFSNLVDEGRSS